MQCNKLSSSSAVGRARAPLRSPNGSASAPSDVLSKNSRSLVRRGWRAPLTSIRFGAIAVYLFRRSLLVSYPCLSPKRFPPPLSPSLVQGGMERQSTLVSLSLAAGYVLLDSNATSLYHWQIGTKHILPLRVGRPKLCGIPAP